jgi:O-antigen ligase
VLFDVDWFLQSLVGMGPVILRIRLALLIPLTLGVLLYGRPRDVYWPLALFLLLHLLHVPFVPNRGLAMIGFKHMLVFFIVFTATISLVRTPTRILTLFKMFVLSFVWFVLHGMPGGQVGWHTELGNRDAFGPLGVMAIGLGYYVAMGARPKSWKYLGFTVSALGVLAVVASFARGAFLGAAVVGGLIWIRSPRKFVALVGGLAAIVLLFVAAELVHPGGAFWDEMATIQDGNTEGTGASRWRLWTSLAWPVFLANPIFGVGANCIGVVGTEFVDPGVLPGKYARPETLYHRPLHNVYFQLLSEQGLVGTTLWLIMLVDFFRRLRGIRAPSARAIWQRTVGGRIDILYLSLGLEAVMVGFLVGGVFYNQLYRHWFYTLVLFAILLSEVTRRAPTRTKQPIEEKGPEWRTTARVRGGAASARPSLMRNPRATRGRGSPSSSPMRSKR